MNWKIVECKLVLIIGIVVLACLDTPSDGSYLYWLRLGVIAFLALMLVILPLHSGWYINEKLKEKEAECVELKRKLEDAERIKNSSVDCFLEKASKDMKKLSDDIEKLQTKNDKLSEEIEKLKNK